MKQMFIMIFLLLLVSACGSKVSKPEVQPVVSLSVSSDGRYVVSAHHGKQLVLWDLLNHSSRVISDDANIYSAYFVKGTDKFIWQGVKDNTVHIQSADGNEIKTFNPGFASYGHVLSQDLKTYLASDIDWAIFKFSKGRKTLLKPGDEGPGFKGIGLTQNLNLSLDGHYLLSGVWGNDYTDKDLSETLHYEFVDDGGVSVKRSRMAGLMLWNVVQGKALHHLGGNVFKTNATLSPDGKYVVAGDENTLGFVWDAHTGKRLLDLDDLKFGRYTPKNDPEQLGTFDHKVRLLPPKDFCFKVDESRCLYQDPIFAMKFISPTQYLRFTTHVYYAILYDVLDPQPKKYFKLEGFPDVNGYSEAARTDTAPEAGILVMGAAAKSGIRVYQYDKENETLQLVWAPDDFDRTKLADNPKT